METLLNNLQERMEQMRRLKEKKRSESSDIPY